MNNAEMLIGTINPSWIETARFMTTQKALIHALKSKLEENDLWTTSMQEAYDDIEYFSNKLGKENV